MERNLSQHDIGDSHFSYQHKKDLPPLTIEEEKQIILGVKEGNLEGVGTLVEHFGRDVYKHVFYMIRNPDLANDLVGDTFVKIIDAIEKYEHRESSIKHWIVRIAHNLTLDHIRRKSNRATTAFIDDLGHPNLSHEFEQEVVEGLDSERDSKKAISLIDRLKPQQAEVIRMRFLEEMSYQAVAERTGQREAYVRVLQHRALRKLKREFDSGPTIEEESVA